MSFDIEKVLKDMVSAIDDSVKDIDGDIKEYADTIIKNEKESLKELGEARVHRQIPDEVFDREVSREKKVVETELLTIQLMTEAAVQRAVNAAINVFIAAVKAAI
jgi:hypothetical protein